MKINLYSLEDSLNDKWRRLEFMEHDDVIHRFDEDEEFIYNSYVQLSKERSESKSEHSIKLINSLVGMSRPSAVLDCLSFLNDEGRFHRKSRETKLEYIPSWNQDGPMFSLDISKNRVYFESMDPISKEGYSNCVDVQKNNFSKSFADLDHIIGMDIDKIQFYY